MLLSVWNPELNLNKSTPSIPTLGDIELSIPGQKVNSLSRESRSLRKVYLNLLYRTKKRISILDRIDAPSFYESIICLGRPLPRCLHNSILCDDCSWYRSGVMGTPDPLMGALVLSSFIFLEQYLKVFFVFAT
jgi:hypothetical protein